MATIMEYLPLLMLAPLSVLIVSDFRRREVSVMWLLILAIGTVCIPMIQDGGSEVLERSCLNLLLILYMSTGIVLWGWVKARKFVNPINVYIGLGDFLFFLTLVPLFPVRQYAWLLVACMGFSLVWWGVAAILKNKSPKNVPFIGTSGIVLACVILCKVLFE